MAREERRRMINLGGNLVLAVDRGSAGLHLFEGTTDPEGREYWQPIESEKAKAMVRQIAVVGLFDPESFEPNEAGE